MSASTGGMPDRGGPRRSRFARLGAAFLVALALVPVLASALNAGPGPTAREQAGEYRRELRSYLWGIGLALVLTVVPFALVHWSMLSRETALMAIGGFALVQIVVHFRFFLHIDLSRQKREDLQLILFSGLILTIMIGGTIWILFNLATRMHV